MHVRNLFVETHQLPQSGIRVVCVGFQRVGFFNFDKSNVFLHYFLNLLLLVVFVLSLVAFSVLIVIEQNLEELHSTLFQMLVVCCQFLESILISRIIDILGPDLIYFLLSFLSIIFNESKLSPETQQDVVLSFLNILSLQQ